MTSVFDVASEMITRSPQRMESVKLQKLCFYAFGWYAHLTNEALFDEAFYAMAKGPVVGELLSAHAQSTHVDLTMLQRQQVEREEGRSDTDPYLTAVLDAVWGAYGSMSSWDLVDLTHTEEVWTQAWNSRDKPRRGDLPHKQLISYFAERVPRASEGLALPQPMVSRIDAAALTRSEEEASQYMPFVTAIRRFTTAA